MRTSKRLFLPLACPTESVSQLRIVGDTCLRGMYYGMDGPEAPDSGDLNYDDFEPASAERETQRLDRH
jgi:hypothetical protein